MFVSAWVVSKFVLIVCVCCLLFFAFGFVLFLLPCVLCWVLFLWLGFEVFCCCHLGFPSDCEAAVCLNLGVFWAFSFDAKSLFALVVGGAFGFVFCVQVSVRNVCQGLWRHFWVWWSFCLFAVLFCLRLVLFCCICLLCQVAFCTEGWSCVEFCHWVVFEVWFLLLVCVLFWLWCCCLLSLSIFSGFCIWCKVMVCFAFVSGVCFALFGVCWCVGFAGVSKQACTGVFVRRAFRSKTRF